MNIVINVLCLLHNFSIQIKRRNTIKFMKLICSSYLDKYDCRYIVMKCYLGKSKWLERTKTIKMNKYFSLYLWVNGQYKVGKASLLFIGSQTIYLFSDYFYLLRAVYDFAESLHATDVIFFGLLGGGITVFFSILLLSIVFIPYFALFFSLGHHVLRGDDLMSGIYTLILLIVAGATLLENYGYLL